MKKVLALSLGLVCLMWGGCSSDKRVLYIFNWSEYFAENIIPDFQKRFDCKVILDNYASNEEMYAKIKAGASGYDLVFPSTYMVGIMKREKMLRTLDKSKLPNLKNLDPQYLKIAGDNDLDYSVPYMFGTTGIGYRKSKIGELEPSWSIFDRADLKDRMSLLDDMREVLGAALKFKGFSLNSTNEDELAQAAEVAKRWKKNIAKFDNEGYRNSIASGEFSAAQGYSGDFYQVKRDDKITDLEYVVPREGGTMWTDHAAITATAKNLELAHAFINYLYEPAVAASNIMFNYYVCPCLPAYELVDETVRNDPMVFFLKFADPELISKCEFIKDQGEKNALYTKYWEMVKSAN